MKESIKSWLERLWVALPVLAAFLFIIVLLVLFHANPLEAFDAMWRGAFGNTSKTLSVVSFWVPLLLSATGLLVTFSAGLWNIGVEGQIILGAIAASWVALSIQAPSWVLIPLELLAAMAGGALWAMISAVLKTKGKGE